MTDTYAYWRNALNGIFGPVHDGDAQCGFYRKKSKDGGFQPVAIFEHEGQIVALLNGAPTDAGALWSWVCDKPVTEVAYNQAIGGNGWPDDAHVRPTSNLPTDPREALEIELAAEIEAAQEYLKAPVTSKETADQIAVLTKRLSTIKNKATDLHKVAKQPHLDAGRKVDDDWRNLKETPDDFGKRLKRHLDAYLQEQDRLERERQRAAREEADRKQREAEDAARIAAATGDNEAAKEAERMAEAAAEAERQTIARNASAGRTGAKVALRTVTFAEITDFDALLMALKDRPETKELVETLANRAARSGVSLPGMLIKEEKRAA